jgi:hypothetical protein
MTGIGAGAGWSHGNQTGRTFLRIEAKLASHVWFHQDTKAKRGVEAEFRKFQSSLIMSTLPRARPLFCSSDQMSSRKTPDAGNLSQEKSNSLCRAQGREDLANRLCALLREPFLTAFVVNIRDAKSRLVALCPLEITEDKCQQLLGLIGGFGEDKCEKWKEEEEENQKQNSL